MASADHTAADHSADVPPGPSAEPVTGPEDDGSGNPVWTAITAQANLQLPDFAAFTLDDFSDACRRAVSQQTDAITAIIADETPATFHNTTVRIDTARYPALLLSRLVDLYSSALSTPESEPVMARIKADLHAAALEVLLSPDLFQRLETVSTVDLLPEDRRHHELLIADFVHAGARLDENSREAAATISAELSSLETEFGQTLLAETNVSALHFATPEALNGLGEAALSAAAARAAARHEDGWTLALQNTSQQDALAELHDPDIRHELLKASLSRGSRGNAYDTRAIVSDITALRASLAGLMGYRTYGGYAIDQQMAGDPEDASALLSRLLEPAQRQFETELDAIRHALHPGRLKPADVAYHLREYGKQEFGVDVAEAAKYFEFERVLRDGVLYAATQLYGITFQRSDQQAWDPDVIVLEAIEDNRPLGLICIDPYARDSKRGGAWMSELVPGAWYTGERPILTLTLNLPKPGAGEPTLLAPDSVRTVFHEFGHVLHGLFSDSTYPTRSGTSVPRDFVEFPSQLNEMWMFHRQVLPNYAVHVETGEGIPSELVDKLQRAEEFGQGFSTVEYLAAALLDLGWHSLEPGEQVDAVMSFESEVLSAAGFGTLVPPRYRSPYFAHIFSHGYAAGYYSYLWSEVLAAYAAEWFTAQGGLNPDAGEAFRKAILAPGYSVNLERAVDDFFGGKPGIAPLLRRRGLPVDNTAAAEESRDATAPPALPTPDPADAADSDDSDGVDSVDGIEDAAGQPGTDSRPADPDAPHEQGAGQSKPAPAQGPVKPTGTCPISLPSHLDPSGTADLGSLTDTHKPDRDSGSAGNR